MPELVNAQRRTLDDGRWKGCVPVSNQVEIEGELVASSVPRERTATIKEAVEELI